jgi:hypothetical protein
VFREGVDSPKVGMSIFCIVFSSVPPSLADIPLSPTLVQLIERSKSYVKERLQ